MKINSNFTVFILFFGVALIEAIQAKNWLSAFLFLALGFMFLKSDSNKKD